MASRANPQYDDYKKIVMESITNTHLYKAAWMALREEKYLPIKQRFGWFWAAIWYSLQHTYLSELSLLFDTSGRFPLVVSLPEFVENYVDDQTEKVRLQEKIEVRRAALDSLKVLRDKTIAHKDADVATNPEQFYEENKILYDDLDALLDLAHELFGDVTLLASGKAESIGVAYSRDVTTENTADAMALILKGIEASKSATPSIPLKAGSN